MRKILLFILFIILPTLANAQEVIASYDKNGLSVLNEELRQSSSGIQSLKGQVADLLPIDLASSSDVSGILAVENGGTGVSVAPGAITIDALLPTQTGNSGKFLTTNGSASSWGSVNSAGYSNALFQWHGQSQADVVDGSSGVADSLTTAPNPATNRVLINTAQADNVVFKTKFIKTSGISTVTVYEYVGHNGAGSNTATFKCVVGTVNGSTTRNSSQTAIAWISYTIDVSSLVNGTAYDVTLYINNSSGTGKAYIFDLIAFGS